MKAEHRMGRNYPKGRDGDRINAVLAAAGYNFSLLPSVGVTVRSWSDKCRRDLARDAAFIDRDRGPLPIAGAGGVKLHFSPSLIDWISS